MTRRNKKWYINHKEENGIIYRKCTKCSEWFVENEENFYAVNKSKPERGFLAECKECCVRRSWKYIENNREQYLEYMQNYNATRYANDEEFKNVHKRKAEKQREEGGQRRWQQSKSGKDKLREYREKRKIKDHKITKDEWESCKNYFSNACAYCGLNQEEHFIKRKGKLINMELHKEHVDDEGCGDLENCIPACQSCNSSKHTAKLDEWYSKENHNYAKERYDKISKWISEDYKKYIKPKKPKGKYIKDINNPRWINSI